MQRTENTFFFQHEKALCLNGQRASLYLKRNIHRNDMGNRGHLTRGVALPIVSVNALDRIKEEENERREK
jgi:hypothetical protein